MSSSGSEDYNSSAEEEEGSSQDSSSVEKKKKSSKKKSKKGDKKKDDKKKKKDKKLKKAESDKSLSKKEGSKKNWDKVKKSLVKKNSGLEDGITDLKPKNPDGTLYKTPLKFWTGRPKELNEIGAKVIMRPNPGTDLFCRGADSIVDNACFYWHKFDGDFNVLVKVKGQFKNSYEKAGIMLRQDEKNWVLSGLEYYGGRLCLCSYITRNITDWSLAPLADEKAAMENGLWIAIKRQEGRIACFYSTDLNDWIQTRMGPFEAEDTLKVGIAATCPGTESYKVVFERFGIQAME